MRQARVKADGGGYYHVMSRVIERKMAMGIEEKEKFRKLLRAVSEFCGVKILTYALLDNHFHILLQVPTAEKITDEELIRRLGLVYGRERVKGIAECLGKAREEGEKAAERYRAKFTYRMYEVSQFMKMLKQRYTQWHNRRHGRSGTLWEQRFKSILVERSERALTTMAAYIDLNAVRAGVVGDPKDYRFSGYGEAMGGSPWARQGVGLIMKAFGVRATAWKEMAARYRMYLFQRGEEKGLGPGDKPLKPGISRERVERVLSENGKLSLVEALHCRVRYFTDGLALGSKEYVEGVFRKHRDQFGARRRTGARAMKWGEWGGLCTARALRLEVVSLPETAG